MSESKQREAERLALLEQIGETPWEVHVAAIFDEIAALATQLGVSTPSLTAAGFTAGNPGTVLHGLQAQSEALKQLQEIAAVQRARNDVLFKIVCRLAPGMTFEFQALMETAVGLAKQAQDPDKVAARQAKSPILIN